LHLHLRSLRILRINYILSAGHDEVFILFTARMGNGNTFATRTSAYCV
jgi:hypothetical protein